MIQPRDPRHPIYKEIDELLEPGDQKVIRESFSPPVSQTSVSLVKNGKSRSKRIWKKIMEVYGERKKQREEFMKQVA